MTIQLDPRTIERLERLVAEGRFPSIEAAIEEAVDLYFAEHEQEWSTAEFCALADEALIGREDAVTAEDLARRYAARRAAPPTA